MKVNVKQMERDLTKQLNLFVTGKDENPSATAIVLLCGIEALSKEFDVIIDNGKVILSEKS